MSEAAQAPRAPVATTPAPASETEKAKQKTEYAVLEAIDLPDGRTAWAEIGVSDGGTKDDAVRAAVGEREGLWKGVPTRSWRGAIRTSVTKVTKTVSEVVDV